MLYQSGLWLDLRPSQKSLRQATLQRASYSFTEASEASYPTGEASEGSYSTVQTFECLKGQQLVEANEASYSIA